MTTSAPDPEPFRMDPFTMATMMEQIKSITAQQSELANRLTTLTDRLEVTYVPKAVYAAHREADIQRIHQLEKDNESAETFRRQVAAGFIVGFILLLIPLIGAVSQFVKA